MRDPGAPDVGDAETVVLRYLDDAGIEYERPRAGQVVVLLPGERKQRTTASLVIGRHAVSVNAFVSRQPDENHEAVYRYLLERNLRTYGVSFAVDALGDIYLAGRIPVGAVTDTEVDRVLGSVLDLADGAFNTILELGFATSIRREWAWRLDRGESTANLTAFEHLRPPSTD